MKNQSNRNGAIELWRFILIGAIGIMHFSNSYYGSSPYFGGAYVATEFFFIVSGYLLFVSFYKNRAREEKINAWQFTFHRIKNLYPCYLLSFLVLFCFIMVQDKASLSTWITNFSQSAWELSFLQISGLKGFRLFNYPAWYISAMLIVGYFIYALLELNEKKFAKLYMPLAVLGIYCFFSKNAENIDVWGGAKILDISDALMRAFAGMSLGGICYYASLLIKKKQRSSVVRVLLSIGELAAFLLSIFLMNQKGHTQIDFYIILLLAVGITLSFSEQTYITKLLSKQPIVWIGKLSYPMFLNQIFVIYLIGAYLNQLSYSKGIVIFMMILIAISFIELLILQGLNCLKTKVL